MKEIYQTPLIEVSVFEESDIITSSSDDDSPIELPMIPIWNG